MPGTPWVWESNFSTVKCFDNKFPGWIKRCCKCRICTGFQRLSIKKKNIKYFINDLYIDYMLK